MKKKHIIPADPTDVEDFDVSVKALDRGHKARTIRKSRKALGLSQAEFAARFCIPLGTLRDWEQARVSPPDFAVAYVRIAEQYPDIADHAVRP